jgi:site-specific recombinase XerD
MGQPRVGGWSTKKQDDAPRGVRRHPSGVWGIRYVCGAGCLHKKKIGPTKEEAKLAYYEHRVRAHREPGWCPRVERGQERERAARDQAQAARRRTFRAFADEYLAWARLHHRGWRTEQSRIELMQQELGDLMLDRVTPADVERFLDALLKGRSQATRNRYRTMLHAMFNRATRHGLVPSNPVGGIGKFKEPDGRTLYLTKADETAVRDALRPELRALFTVSVHTGLRWSEQRALRWADVDFLTGLIAVTRSKSGHSRQIPMNSLVRSVVMDLATARHRPYDPTEPVFVCPHAQADKFFPKAVARAQAMLREAGQDASRLEGYTWHCNRHTFASRLVMAGVDLRSVQQLGGWRTLTMVQRYRRWSGSWLQSPLRNCPTTVPPSRRRKLVYRKPAPRL